MLNFEVKIFFIDLDGTLLDNGKHALSIENANAIKNANSKSEVVISTGRGATNFVKKLMTDFNLKYAICQNGALIIDKNFNKLLDIHIPIETVSKIVDLIKKYNVYFLMNSKGNFFGPNKSIFRHLMKIFSEWKSVKYSDYKKNQEHINKILLIAPFKRRLRKFQKKLISLNLDLNSTFTSKGRAIEITAKEASKGLASIFVANLLGVNPKNTIHIGDSMNDSTTLGKVGALIALENSSKDLKEIADFIGPKSKQGGVAKVMKGELKKNIKNKK